MFFFLILIISIFIFHFLSDTELSLDIFLSCFSVVSYFLLIIVSDVIELDISTQRFINFCSIVAATALLGYSVSPLSHLSTFEGNVYLPPYLTYGFDNSNYAEIITLLVYSMIFLTMETAGNKMRKLCIVLEILLFYCIYETNTRSVLVVAVVIPFLGMLFRKLQFKNWILILLCLIPFLFVPFYLSLSNSGNAEDVQLLGKSVMSGRQVVYTNLTSLHHQYQSSNSYVQSNC